MTVMTYRPYKSQDVS